MSEITKKCPICEEPYKVYEKIHKYTFYAEDQFACPSCRWKAQRKERAEKMVNFIKNQTR